MKLTDEQKAKKKKVAASKKLGDQLLGYIEQVGIELGYPKDLAGYIAHHAIWDAIANSVTTHAGEYAVVSKAQVKAYHGSPYDFEKFTTKKMGTGEGAQAFGWGLYFADIKSIAEEYARKLSSVKAINDVLDKIGIRETTFRVKEVMKEYLPNDVKSEWLIEALESNYYDNFRNEELDQLKKFAEYKLKNNNSIPLSKKVYSVSLHEGKTPDQYTWLEWDKELTPNQIKDILEKDIDGSIQEALYDYYSKYNDISTVDELIDTIYTENTTGEGYIKSLKII
jgi:hypothetical protein